MAFARISTQSAPLPSRCGTAPLEFRIPDAASKGVAETVEPSLEADAQGAALKAIRAALQLFDLCPPQDGGTIRRTDLEDVLRVHLGQGEAACGVQRHFNTWDQDTSSGLLDFLSYWHGMDLFFAEAGAWPVTSRLGHKTSILSGMRTFRDGVLGLWRRFSPHGQIPGDELLELLAEVQACTEDPEFWNLVMRAVPHRGANGLSLGELGVAVCDWLRRHSGGGGRRQTEQPVSTSLGTGRRRSLSASAILCLTSDASTATPRSVGASPWSEGARGRDHRRSDLLVEGVCSPAGEIQRAVEFAEFISKSLDPDTHAHQAQQQLLASLSSVGRTLMRQETDLSSLRNSNTALGQKKQLLEAELEQAKEFHEDLRELQEQRDAEHRRAEALEHDLVTLKDQTLHLSEELKRLRSASDDAERQRLETERRDWQWRDHCSQLEQAADNAEGQARWMREELEKQRGELSNAKDEKESMTNEISRLRRLLESAADSVRSHAAHAAESDQCTEELRRQLSATTSPNCQKAAGTPRASCCINLDGSDSQENLHRTQLELLRCMRDELLKLDSTWAQEQASEDSPESPRRMQLQRHCRFLEMQLQALLRHTQSVENVLDTQRDSHLGPSPDVRRRLSIQRVQQDGEALFNELSERLHTLEVQKADADQEVQRLQATIADLKRELSAATQCREELLLELRTNRSASVRDELQACLLKKNEIFMGEEAAATSETRSVSSSGVRDCDGFLPEARGAVHPSPKCVFTTGVHKVINAQFLTSHTGGLEHKEKRGQRQRKEEDRSLRGNRKADGDCDMQ